eukprot:gene2478-12995_t
MADPGPWQQPVERDEERQRVTDRWERELAELNGNQERFLQAFLDTKPNIDAVLKLRQAFANEIREWQLERQDEKRAFCRAIKQQQGATMIEPLYTAHSPRRLQLIATQKHNPTQQCNRQIATNGAKRKMV